MIHYSCDRCKRLIDPVDDARYVVNMEVQAVIDPVAGDELEDDRDHLLEVHEILERLDDDHAAFDSEMCQQRRYDLCPECYRKFVKNPIGREAPAELGFSQN